LKSVRFCAAIAIKKEQLLNLAGGKIVFKKKIQDILDILSLFYYILLIEVRKRNFPTIYK
jgi:hypothetical protein